VPFSIKNEEADRLVRQLTAATGESLTQAVVCALRERLARQKIPARRTRAGTQLAALAARLRKMPVRDRRTADEILGYDENGLPG
jgi:antitoxin VapB